jgi:hypothetical protein
MPKGDIVGMFTGRACLSLMARKTWYGYKNEQQRHETQAECAYHLMENRLRRHRKCRQEENTYGGQISGIGSEHRDRPSLDPGEPTLS